MEEENKLYLADTKSSSMFSINIPPSIQITPQKDMTGYEAWQLTQLALRFTQGWNTPSREELEGMDSGVRRHFVIKDNIGYTNLDSLGVTNDTK